MDATATTASKRTVIVKSAPNVAPLRVRVRRTDDVRADEQRAIELVRRTNNHIARLARHAEYRHLTAKAQD